MVEVHVVGLASDGFMCSAIVHARSSQDVYNELIECMGIEASNEREFIEALQLIGFNTSSVEGRIVDALPCVEIPINMHLDDELF